MTTMDDAIGLAVCCLNAASKDGDRLLYVDQQKLQIPPQTEVLIGTPSQFIAGIATHAEVLFHDKETGVLFMRSCYGREVYCDNDYVWLKRFHQYVYDPR